MRTRRVIAGVLVLALAASLASGCSAGSKDESAGVSGQAVGPAIAPEPDVATRDIGAAQTASPEEWAGAPSADGADAASVERMVVRNGSLDLRVDDVDSAVNRVRAAVRSAGGEIGELSVSGGTGELPVEPAASGKAEGATSAYITIRVPAEKLDALTAALSKLGTVVSQSESASDVTEQAVDTEARLKNLRAEEDRLRSFLDRAGKIEDLLAVERELSRVRGEIEAMDAQLTYLKRQVAKATLTVTLSEPVSVVGPESPWYGLREAFSRGVQGAIVVVQALITVVVAALPLLILVGLIVGVVVLAARRHGRRSARRAAAQTEAKTETDTTEEDVDQ